MAQRFELELIDLRQVDKAGPSKRAEKKAKQSQRGQPSQARFVHAHLSADVGCIWGTTQGLPMQSHADSLQEGRCWSDTGLKRNKKPCYLSIVMT